MVAPPEIVDLGNASLPGGPQATVTEIPEELRNFRIWPIILLVLGVVLELVCHRTVPQAARGRQAQDLGRVLGAATVGAH